MKPRKPKSPGIKTLEQVRAILGVGVNYSLDLVHTGKLRAAHVGNRWLVKQEWLDKFLEDEADRNAKEISLGGKTA